MTRMLSAARNPEQLPLIQPTICSTRASVAGTPAGRAVRFALSLALAASTTAFAQPDKVAFEPFDHFVENTRSAHVNDFAARRESRVRDAAAFEEMRQSILHRYDGVHVSHSFMVGNLHYDCVPVNEQPALRTYGLSKVADLPPQSLAAKAVVDEGNIKPAQFAATADSVDASGNPTSCEAGETPMMRTTLDMLSRFPTLQDFYRKIPGGALAAAQARGKSGGSTLDPNFVNPAVAAHKYSYTYQYVNNLGGNSNLNIWTPYVNTGLGEIFSLSQEWYVGGSGSGTQTEEVGWVVYPAMFGDERAHFFIFSTADNYASGCWNNTCGDFVQVADSGLLGNWFSTVSSYGGTQYDFSAEYYLYQGNWWLSFQGTWVGYYPGSKYHGGQNSRFAQLLEFGSESVGTTIWPPEGSGQWPSTGWSHAAYQRNLWYIANTSSYASYWDTLTRAIPSPACYSIAGPYSSSSSGWQVYFYEGGPGGGGC